MEKMKTEGGMKKNDFGGSCGLILKENSVFILN